jgi:phage N-6-adenine-methyltransferase
MKGAATLFSSGNDVTGTDPAFFAKLNEEFGGFRCDVAALRHNRKVENYFGPDHDDPARRDCLTIDWPLDRPNFMNPPYSDAYPFVQKASEQAARGVTTVCLLAARTDTRWFHDFIYSAHAGCFRTGVEVRFIKGRLKFEGHKNSAPFPSMLVVFHGRS